MSIHFVQRLAWCLALLAAPLPMFGVSLQPLSIEALTRHANTVVQGTVLSKTCQRDPEGRLYTRVELKVGDVWKGAVTGNPLIVVHGGGVLGEEQSVVSYQVHYDVGEEVVAFLVHNSRGEGVTVGLMQGKFHVRTEPGTGGKFAANPFHGTPGTLAYGGQVRKAGTGATLLSVSELKARVQEAAR